MKIYVASSFLNKAEVKETQALLRSAGHHITWDWTNHFATGARGSDEWQRCLFVGGRDDYKGIFDAQVGFILNDLRMRDTLTEFGMFLGQKKPVVFVRGDAFKTDFTTVFLMSPGVQVVDTVGEGIVALQRMADGLHVYTKGEPDCVMCGAFGPVDDPDCELPCDWKPEGCTCHTTNGNVGCPWHELMKGRAA